MLVDPVTVLAQAVNFVGLVWLLQRFLYRPIVEAMRERQERIAREAESARQAQAEARASRERYERLRAELAAAREDEMAAARADAERFAARRRQEARREVEVIQRRWLDALAREQSRFWQDFEARIAAEVLDTADQVLSDLAGVSLEQRIRERFLQQLAGMEAGAAAGLAAPPVTGEGSSPGGRSLQCVSAHDLDQEYKDRLLALVRRLLDTEQLAVEFARRPGLLAGIELRGDGWKVGWSLRGYIDGLRRRIDSHVAEATAVQPASGGEVSGR